MTTGWAIESAFFKYLWTGQIYTRYKLLKLALKGLGTFEILQVKHALKLLKSFKLLGLSLIRIWNTNLNNTSRWFSLFNIFIFIFLFILII